MALDADRAARLLQSGVALSSELALDILLQRTVELAAELTGARYAALGVVHEGRVIDFLTTGLSPEERRAIGDLPHGRGVLGALVGSSRPLRLHDLAEHPSSVGFPPNHPPMRTFLGTAVRARGVVYGNLYLTEKQPGGDFTAEDEEAITVLATQAGVAVANATLYRETHLRERWLEVIRDVSYQVLSGTASERVLRLLARHARELSDADIAMVLTPTGDGEHLEVVVAEGERAEAVDGMRVPVQGSTSGRVFRDGHSAHVPDAERASDAYAPMVDAAGLGPSMFIPLASAGSVAGVLTVARAPRMADFRDVDLLLLESFGAQAALALDYGRAQRDLRRLEVAEDRERIARELHDGVIQALFAVGLGIQGAAASLEDARLRARLEQAVTEIDGVIGDLRRYIFGLRPGVLASGGLNAALEQLCADSERRSGVTTVLDVDSAVEDALTARETDVVQLVREALSNVARHARATTCRVSLRREGGAALVEVDDDGVGFDASAPDHGMGLPNLRSRAARLGGEVGIDSSPGQGTTVRVLLPLA